MITAGIDIGNAMTKAVLLDNRTIVSKEIMSSFEGNQVVFRKILDKILSNTGMAESDLDYVVTTGTGGKSLDCADKFTSDINAITVGTQFYYPNAEVLLNIGAEKIFAILCKENAEVLRFNMNDKCAAGSGMFLEYMSEVLEIQLEDMADLSLSADRSLPITSQCAVFAESEVIGQIHRGEYKASIVRGIHESIATSVKRILTGLGNIDSEVYFSGGVANDRGMQKALEESLETDIVVLEDPQFIGALGAALVYTQ